MLVHGRRTARITKGTDHVGVDAQQDQRCDGRTSGAVGRKTVQVVLRQKLGGNGVDGVRLNGPPGLGQRDEQLGAVVVGCGGDVGVQCILRAYRRRLQFVNGVALMNQSAFATGADEVDGPALNVPRRPR